MPTDSEIGKVKELLANGKTEDAADLLLELAKDADEVNYSSALMLKNQLEQLQQDVIDGVVSDSEQRLNWAKISRRIIELARQIEKGEGPKKVEDLLPTNQKTKPVTAFPKWLVWGIPIVLLIGFWGVKQFTKNKPPNGTMQVERANPPKTEILTLKGKLITSDKNPMSGIKIIIKPLIDDLLDGKKDIQFTTDQSGNFSFEYPKLLERKYVNVTFLNEGKKIDRRESIRFLPETFQLLTVQN